MDEYINKHEAYTMMKDLEATYIYPPVKEAYGTAARRIDQMPTADVQLVKFARWIDLDNRILCSGCGAGYDDSNEVKRNTYIFCPNCGARMIRDGGTNG